MWAELKQAARDDLPLVAIVALYALATLALFGLRGLPPVEFGGIRTNATLYGATIFFGLLGWFVWALLRDRPPSPFVYIPRFLDRHRIVLRLIASLPALAAITILAPFFSAMKSAIPAFNAYAHDALFVRLDQAIHGGHAWELIHPVVGYPAVSFALSTAYQLWILLLYLGVWLVAIWIERPALRLQFLIAYALGWIVIGTLFAIGMASVGPCFLDDFYGDQSFRPLMDYLAEVDRTWPILALDVQQGLVAWRADGDGGLGRGISAMPSMHVAIAALFAIVGWKYSRAAGAAMTAFLVLILLGSVHLGYHYAIDGYLALLLTPLLWWTAGKIAAGWIERRNPVGSLATA